MERYFGNGELCHGYLVPAPSLWPSPGCEFAPLRLKAFRDSLIAEKLSRTVENHTINGVGRIVKRGMKNELFKTRVRLPNLDWV
jgi:hypothetical protein